MIEPLNKRVLVKRDETKTEVNGILLAASAQRQENSGTVIAIGPEVTEVRVGERVLFGKIDGVPIDVKYCDNVKENNFILINEEQIKAIYV